MSWARGAPARKAKRIFAPGLRSPSMSVGNHWRSWPGSVSARQTRSGGWAMCRSKRSTYRPSSRIWRIPVAA